MRIRMSLMCLMVALSLTHCATYDLSKPVRQQGNLLPHAKIDRLKIGMSKSDAAILMGTSLLSPSFNNDRWDYAFSLRKGGHASIIRHLSLYFVNDKLTRIERHR